MTGWSIGPGHELRQLGAGVDAQLGERIVDVVFHRMQGKVQLYGDVAVGSTLRNQVDHLELGVGEAVPARFGSRVADDTTFHAQSAQRATHPAGIGEGFVVQVGVECGIELIQRPVSLVGACEFIAGVLGSRGVKKRPRR